VRPEVADALGGLEQSLVDVATLQRLQASPVPPPPPPPAGSEVPSGRVEGAAAVAGAERAAGEDAERDPGGDAEGADAPQLLTAYADGLQGAPGDEAEIPLVLPPPPSDLPPELQIDLDPPVRPVDDDPDARILSRFSGDQVVDELESSGAVLAAARGVQGVQPPTPAQMEAEQRARRGGWLMWVGAVILICAAAAFWLIPDRSDDSDQLPAVGDRSSTTVDSLLLDPNELTTTSTTALPTTTTSEAPVVTVAPTTTVKSSGSSKPKKPTTTTPPATVPETTTTLGQPGPPGTSAPRPLPTTPTTAPPTTTTTPPGSVVTLPQSEGE
jgi:hypothetical protein